MGRPDLAALPPEAQQAIAHCFGCGADNPVGLHLVARREGGKTVVDWQPDRRWAGWDTVLHGGLLATLIDEAAAFALFDEPGFRTFAMTRTLKVTYKRRVHWTRPVRAEAWTVRRDADRAVLAVQVLQDGQVGTEGEVEFRLFPRGPPPAGR